MIGRGKRLRDMLMLGVLIFRTATKGASGVHLAELVKIEKAASNVPQFESLMDR